MSPGFGRGIEGSGRCAARDMTAGIDCTSPATTGKFCEAHAWQVRADQAAMAASALARLRPLADDPKLTARQRRRVQIEIRNLRAERAALLEEPEMPDSEIVAPPRPTHHLPG